QCPTMRSVLLLLISLASATALQCFVPGTCCKEDGYTRNVTMKADCPDPNEEYCMKMWTVDPYTNKTTVYKQCGGGMCKSEGCDDVAQMCCCKGRLCNAASGPALLMTSLAAAAVALLRLY
ncbi:hypothetical protein PMAYCL1PPCAC_20290, partial [Pristionchus mayeri]